MLHFITDLLKQFGIWGLLSGLAIEASSLPFPGSLLTLTYGYLLNMHIVKLLLIALAGSAVYTAFSFIPYGIGYKLEDKVKKKLSKKKKHLRNRKNGLKNADYGVLRLLVL